MNLSDHLEWLRSNFDPSTGERLQTTDHIVTGPTGRPVVGKPTLGPRLPSEPSAAQRAAENAEQRARAAEHAEQRRLAEEHAAQKRLADEHARQAALAAEHAEQKRLADEHRAAAAAAAAARAAQLEAQRHAEAQRVAQEHARNKALAEAHQGPLDESTRATLDPDSLVPVQGLTEGEVRAELGGPNDLPPTFRHPHEAIDWPIGLPGYAGRAGRALGEAVGEAARGVLYPGGSGAPNIRGTVSTSTAHIPPGHICANERILSAIVSDVRRRVKRGW